LLDEGCESEEEGNLSNQMFFDDIKQLREIVKAALSECLAG
jgi:hypothetical protein